MRHHPCHDVLVLGPGVRVIDSLKLLEQLTDCGLDLRILLLIAFLLDLLQGVLNLVLRERVIEIVGLDLVVLSWVLPCRILLEWVGARVVGRRLLRVCLLHGLLV